jgi:diguanylate cyclase
MPAPLPLRAALWRETLHNHPQGLLVNTAAVLGTAGVLHAAPLGWLLAWVGASLGLSWLRVLLYLRCRRELQQAPARQPPASLLAAHHLGVTAAGLLWAALAWWGIAHLAGAQQFTVLVILSALAGGATGTLAPMRLTGKLYVLLLLLPACAQLGLHGGIEHLSLAVLGAIFAAVMLTSHEANHKLLVHAIALALDKAGLIEQLSAQTEQVVRANAELEERVAHRTGELHHMAHHDQLTGLLNRRGLLAGVPAVETPEQALVSAIFIDLDRFKRINDGLGHEWGDLALQAVAQRLAAQAAQLAGDIAAWHHGVGRWGGDEFVVCLLHPAGSARALAQGVEQLQRVLSQPYPVLERTLDLGASLGCATQPLPPDLALQQPIGHADLAASEAKRLGRGRVVFTSPALLARQQRRVQLSEALATATTDGSLHLVYQPIVAAGDGQIVALEALLRWHCPGFGEVSPAEFIPLAEESDQIVRIGAWVLQQACRTAAQWAGGHAPKVAVNTSIKQLVWPHFAAQVAEALQACGLPPDHLVVEVTESVFDELNSQQALANLQALKALGVEIHVDDFGTGYSSLSRLLAFPLHAVKIDKSFVLAQDERAMAVIEGTVLMAHRFGLHVIAEGVETADQASALARLGVDELQGYHCGRPSRDTGQPMRPAANAVATV